MIRTEQLEDGAVLRIVLNAPKANIIDGVMTNAIMKALDTDAGPSTKLILFEGEGAHFSFGASVEEHQKDNAAAMLETFHGLFRRLAKLGVPTCALVRGRCLGGGLELASWCTFVVCAPEAKLGQPEIRLAVFPPMASVILPWRAGGQTALDLCITGRTVGAEEALRMGIVNAVSNDLEAWWHKKFDEDLRATSAAALRFAERAVRTDLMARLNTHLASVERLYLDELMATHDANEGIKAFIERRAPEYRDC